MRSSLSSVPRDSTPLIQRAFTSPYKKSPAWYKNKKFYFNLIRRSLAEFLATGLFVFTAVSAASNIYPRSSTEISYQLPAASATLAGITHGLAYGALVAATMHVSGGHLNPAVTLGVFISGGINVLAAVAYFIVQVLGGLAGAACVLAYDPIEKTGNGTWSAVDYGITHVQGVSAGQGLLIEMLLTMVLVMVFVHTTLEKTEFHSVAPIAIGFALTAGVAASYTVTGGSLNPVRSFGPVVVGSEKGKWKDHYVYWIGPLLGSILAGTFYRLFLSSRPLIPLVDDETGATNSRPRSHSLTRAQ